MDIVADEIALQIEGAPAGPVEAQTMISAFNCVADYGAMARNAKL